MTYSYACPVGHSFEKQFRIGEAPSNVECLGDNASCSNLAGRDYGTDFKSIMFGVVDPFRNFHLSSKKMRAESEQQRYVDGPTDNFERKTLEKTYGRSYIGDDTSTLTKHSQESIERYKDRKRSGERV